MLIDCANVTNEIKAFDQNCPVTLLTNDEDYGPKLPGAGIEPATTRLKAARSNQLS